MTTEANTAKCGPSISCSTELLYYNADRLPDYLSFLVKRQSLFQVYLFAVHIDHDRTNRWLEVSSPSLARRNENPITNPWQENQNCILVGIYICMLFSYREWSILSLLYLHIWLEKFIQKTFYFTVGNWMLVSFI